MSNVILYKQKVYTGSSSGGGATYTAGDNIDISIDNVISSDQTEDLTYAQYQALTPAEKMEDKIFFVDDAPEDNVCYYDSTNHMVVFEPTYASYSATTKTVTIGG